MTDPNHPAFPAEPKTQNDYLGITYRGMSKREYFAVMAMQGIIAGMQMALFEGRGYKDAQREMESITASAVLWANALITELNKAAGK